MGQGVAIAPVFVAAFHPVHKLQSFALVVVASCKLDGEGVLLVGQFKHTAFVESLWQYYSAVILVACLYFCLAYEKLCQDDSREGAGVGFFTLACPVYAIQSAEQHVAVFLGEDGAHVELVALKSVADVVVVESVVELLFLVYTLHHHSADAIACGDPHVLVFVFGDATDAVVAEAFVFGDIVKAVVGEVEHVYTFACSYPYQSS